MKSYPHRLHLSLLYLVMLSLAAWLPVSSLQAAGARHFKSGPIQTTADGGWIWVANRDHDSVSRIDGTNDGVLEIPLPDPATPDSPRGLSLKEDGSEVWVACHDSDRVYVLSREGEVLARIDLPWGSGPMSIALARDQQSALVTLHRAEALALLDVPARRLRRILPPVYRAPAGIAWCEDGVNAWITHIFADGEHPSLTRVEVSGAAASGQVKTRMTLFATDPRQTSRLTAPYNLAEGGYLTTRGHLAQIPSLSGRSEVWLPIQYNNITEDTFSPDSTVQAVIRRLHLNTRTVPNGTNDKVILSAVHFHEIASPNNYLGPGWNAGVAGPIDIGFNTAGTTVCLLNEISDDLVVMPVSTPGARPAGAAPLTEINVGQHPIGLALSPVREIAYVYNLLSRDVSVIDLVALSELRRIPVTPLTAEPLAPRVLAGAKLFHTSNDPRISANNKVGCASCHLNAEHDGRTWSFDRLPGAHGPRDTPSLLGLYRTFAPRDPVTGFGQLHRSGDRDEVQDFEHTFRSVNMGGTGFLGAGIQPELGLPNAGRDPDLDALADYLLSLEPIKRSPHRSADGSLTEAAIRGAMFFRGANRPTKTADAGCASCHIPESGFVDFKFHDVGSSRPAAEHELNNRTPAWKVNTPTLIGVWTTPPYKGVATFAPTIIDVLKDQASRANSATPHGKPDGLTRRQMADLEAFVLSIDGNMTAAEVRNAIDNAPPRIVRVEPASLRRLDVWFSESVKRNSVTNPAAWRLETQSGIPVPVISSVWDGQNGDRVSLIVALQPETSYRLIPAETILDEADTATGGVANALDAAQPGNVQLFSISNQLTITLGASGYENLTVPVHDSAMAGPNLNTWSHDTLWLFPVNNSGQPKVNTGFLRWDWRQLFGQVSGVTSSRDILDVAFTVPCESGDAQSVELRRCLLAWFDPATGGDYQQSSPGPTWRDRSYGTNRWHQAGAGILGGTGAVVTDYDGAFDLAAQVDATVPVAAINEPVRFAAPRITEAFRFWFDHPAIDYGYALRLLAGNSQDLRFERSESGLRRQGPVLEITYALPQPPRLSVPTILPGGLVELQLQAELGRPCLIEMSSDLKAWTTVTNLSAVANSPEHIQDPIPIAASTQRFYRATLTP